MMEAVRTSETSVDNHFTRQYNPEDSSEHHTRRRENLKSHKLSTFSVRSLNGLFLQLVLSPLASGTRLFLPFISRMQSVVCYQIITDECYNIIKNLFCSVVVLFRL
jgi:hypothetical protein